MLSRDVSNLAEVHEADGVLVGTYSLTPNSVIVNLRLMPVDSSTVLSVAGLEIQRTRNIDHLLAQTAGSGGMALSAYER